MNTLINIAVTLTVLWLSTATALANKGFICSFPSGMVNTFENDVFQSATAKPLSFEIGDVDLAKQTASLVTPSGKGELKIVRAIGANHFLEVITEGFLNITTIYGEPAGDGSFPAVHSRHIGLLGMPVVSQYLGTCKAK